VCTWWCTLFLEVTDIYLDGKMHFREFSHATDATRRDKAWDRAGKLRLVMRIRTILVAVLISPYFYQKVDGSGVRVSAGSTLPEILFIYAYMRYVAARAIGGVALSLLSLKRHRLALT
jgi:hypothetical protein